MSSPWNLGIDFGTSFTVVAASRDAIASVVDVESNGSSRMPSSVFFTQDEEFLVGTAALHQSVFNPERFEPTPKRAIGEGEVFLGDRLVPIVDLVAAVLRRVYSEACRQQGETLPARVCVTHPADWSATRLNVLREAIEKSGIRSATLVPEPVAAATRFAMATPVGSHIAVYDFGGGTMDAAVLTRTENDFVVAGQPAGRDPLGGEDIDRRIIDYVGTLVGEDDEAWVELLSASDTKGRHNAATLRMEVRRAKETLSEVSACQLWLPGLERAIQLTRVELEGLITSDVDATVDTLQRALEDAHVAPADLAGVYLIGGSSRIPLVADTIWRRLDLRPVVQDNPKSVVALGAAGWDVTSRRQAGSTPVSRLPPASGAAASAPTVTRVSPEVARPPAQAAPAPPAVVHPPAPPAVVQPPAPAVVQRPAPPQVAQPTPAAARVRPPVVQPPDAVPPARPPVVRPTRAAPPAAPVRPPVVQSPAAPPRLQPAAVIAPAPAPAPASRQPLPPPTPGQPAPPPDGHIPAPAALQSGLSGRGEGPVVQQMTESPSSYVATLRRSWRLELPEHLEPFELLELSVAPGGDVELGQVVGRARSAGSGKQEIWEIRSTCAGKVWHVAASAETKVGLDHPLFQVAPVTGYTVDGPHPHPAGPGGLVLTIARPSAADPGVTSLGLDFLNRRFFVWTNASFFFPAVPGTHLVRIQAYRGTSALFSKSMSILVRPNANTAFTFEVMSSQRGRFR